MIRSGRDSKLSDSEDMIGPMLTRAPLRVCVEQDAPVVDLLRRVNCDFEESRNHEIVREDDFRSVSKEASPKKRLHILRMESVLTSFHRPPA